MPANPVMGGGRAGYKSLRTRLTFEALSNIAQVYAFLRTYLFQEASLAGLVPVPQYDNMKDLEQPIVPASQVAAARATWKRIAKDIDRIITADKALERFLCGRGTKRFPPPPPSNTKATFEWPLCLMGGAWKSIPCGGRNGLPPNRRRMINVHADHAIPASGERGAHALDELRTGVECCVTGIEPAGQRRRRFPGMVRQGNGGSCRFIDTRRYLADPCP